MLKKKFSIGLSPFISFEEYQQLFNDFSEFIGEIYFSPFFNQKFQSRSYLLKEYIDKEEEMLQVLRFAKNKGICLELTINSTKDINKNDVELIKEWINFKNIKIDKIVTFSHLAEYSKKIFDVEKITCSYNENLRTYKQIESLPDAFTEVVLGNSLIRDFVAFEKVSKLGCKVKLLINNGCSHNCNWCSTGGNKTCCDIFSKNLLKDGVNYLYAKQSVFPYELFEKYENVDCISLYKLSTRSMKFKELHRTLELYCNNIIPKTFLDLSCVCKLGHLNEYAYKNLHEVSINEIIKIKKAKF